MKQVSVTVTLAPDADIPTVSDQLTRLGIPISDALPEVGILFCQADLAQLDQIREMDEVIEAKPEDHIQLPPLDNDTPQ